MENPGGEDDDDADGGEADELGEVFGCFADGGSCAADEWHGGGVEDAGRQVAGH